MSTLWTDLKHKIDKLIADTAPRDPVALVRDRGASSNVEYDPEEPNKVATPKKPKPGPARIRVALSRQLSHSEQEFIKRGADPVFTFLMSAPVKLRLSGNGHLYAESSIVGSRDLFYFVRDWLEDTFVNVFPTAVRTFRELST